MTKKAAAKPAAKKTAGNSKATGTTGKRKAAAAQRADRKIVKQVKMVNGKRRVTYTQAKVRPVARAAAPVLSAGDLAGLGKTTDPFDLKSNVALVLDQSTAEILFEKNSDVSLPIASLTKLMTALVVVEARQDKDEILEITTDDIDRVKNSSSRLAVGTRLSRASMLHLALMSSENRAASALGPSLPGRQQGIRRGDECQGQDAGHA